MYTIVVVSSLDFTSISVWVLQPPGEGTAGQITTQFTSGASTSPHIRRWSSSSRSKFYRGCCIEEVAKSYRGFNVSTPTMQYKKHAIPQRMLPYLRAHHPHAIVTMPWGIQRGVDDLIEKLKCNKTVSKPVYLPSKSRRWS